MMWTRADAVDFCAALEPVLAHVGFHVALAGGVLIKGYSDHDLDLLVYPHSTAHVDRAVLRRTLVAFGMHLTVEHWRKKGSDAEKHVEVWRSRTRRVDLIFVQ